MPMVPSQELFRKWVLLEGKKGLFNSEVFFLCF